MPFFPNAIFSPVATDHTFNNLFQLMSDIDNYNSHQQLQQQQQEQQRKQAQAQQKLAKQARPARPAKAAPTASARNSLSLPAAPGFFSMTRPFNPRFDVRETEGTYELHGELAGVDRKDVTLEFVEPQTLVIHGKVERNYSRGQPEAEADAEAEAAEPETAEAPDAVADTHSEPDDVTADGARTPAADDNDNDEAFTEVRAHSPARSHRATVTDEETEKVLEEQGEAVEEPAAAATTATATTTVTAAPATPSTVAKPAAPAAQTERYWYQERTVGQFRRVFSFPVPVDEAAVRASLDNGILNVSIPKARRQPRRILVA